MVKRSPLPVDLMVGQNIRICRLQKGMSQSELGERAGVTFQQVQKYEKGANRVGASRLSLIADVLQIPLTVLFEGSAAASGLPPEQSPGHLLAKPNALRLLTAFDKLENDRARLALLELVECLSRKAEPEQGSTRKRSKT